MSDLKSKVMQIDKLIVKIEKDADELIMAADSLEDYEEITQYFIDYQRGSLFQTFRLIKHLPLQQRFVLVNRLLEASNKIKELLFLRSFYIFDTSFYK